ncbi:uncharacterized protein LOC112344425 [Selaginella moellendorffii]|uniref:uncharacterized protein LOC112344425 n=1 Tax=Selaginella moellendorffii TaxID=88036 RepID=UPI000D1CA888|nr:uncharacterized protein LOC112344425 [Selaginella moellendorffii]|eukprot:XP_024524920.1 uncharacterized protein LOC112344425 [Selaginella moellendorffii]
MKSTKTTKTLEREKEHQKDFRNTLTNLDHPTRDVSSRRSHEKNVLIAHCPRLTEKYHSFYRAVCCDPCWVASCADRQEQQHSPRGGSQLQEATGDGDCDALDSLRLLQRSKLTSSRLDSGGRRGQQSITGSVLGALCAAGAFKGVTASYYHLSIHSLVHNAPFGLTDHVNQALLTTVLGLGYLFVAARSLAKLLTQSPSEVSKRLCMKVFTCMFSSGICFVTTIEHVLRCRGNLVFARSCAFTSIGNIHFLDLVD